MAAAVHSLINTVQHSYWAFAYFYCVALIVLFICLFLDVVFFIFFCSWRFIFHDLTFTGSWVWRSCRALLLFGHHICFCHVHPGGYRNLLGQKTDFIVDQIFMSGLKYSRLYSITNVKYLICFPSEIFGAPGCHISRHRPTRDWQCHAEQHARLRFNLPQSDGCGSFCRSEVCQQAGLSFPHLCHYIYRLHLCRSIQIYDSSTGIPVSSESQILKGASAFK